MLHKKDSVFFLTTVYAGYVIVLFLFYRVLFSGVAVGQNLMASLDVRLTSAAGAESVYPASPLQSRRTEIKSLLKNGLFSDALALYQKELRSNPDDTPLIREYEALKKAIRQTAELEQTEDAVQRRLIALQLCNYYRDNEVNRNYLAAALLIYQQSQEQTDIPRVLDAYKRLNKYDDAVYFINTLDIPENTMKMQKASVYLAADNLNKSRSFLRSVQVKQLCDPEELMMLSRLQAAAGLQASSVQTLVKCFESSPENMLASLKRTALNCEEFDNIRDAAEFKAAMKTESQTNAAGYTPSCARKWVGVKIDETPAYIRNFKSKEINFSDWHVK